MAVSIAGTLASAKAQNDKASAQNAFEQNRFAQTKANADANFLSQAAQANLRLQQEGEGASNKIQNIQKGAAKAKATAAVSAGESGVSGISVEQLLADFDRTSAFQTEGVKRNLDFIKGQTATDIEALRAQAANRQIAVLPQHHRGASNIGTALKIGGSVASAFGGRGGPSNISSGAVPAPSGFSQIDGPTFFG